MPTTPSPERAVAVNRRLLQSWPLPAPTGDKHARGEVLVVGGAARNPGAVLLAGLAALRVGAGQLRLAVAAPVATATAVAVPEALVVPLDHDPITGDVVSSATDQVLDVAAGVAALCIGPGLLDGGTSAAITTALLERLPADLPVVVDAQALGALEGERDRSWPARTGLVLTPNLGEAGRMLGLDRPVDVENAARAAVDLSAMQGAVVTVFGATASSDGRLWIDQTGTPGLATSGSGDVLAGAVTGLLARGATGPQAAVWASRLHATAGQICSARMHEVGYLARELMEELPHALSACSRT